jgi:hypothetical protein
MSSWSRSDCLWRLRWIPLAAVVLLIAAYTTQAAYFQMFSLMAVWDDTGYFMLSVRHLLHGQRLYDDVCVPYGPVYYFAKWLLHGPLGFPLTHDVVRLTATVLLLATVAISAGTAFAMTRNGALAALTLPLITFYLFATARNEPGHPQEIGGLLTAAVPAAALLALGRPARAAATLGLLVGALLMVKVNLGVYVGLAVGIALLSAVRATPGAVALRIVSVCGAAALPWLIMRPSLGAAWAQGFAAVGSLWILALAAPTVVWREGGLRPIHLVTFIAAWATGALLSASFALLRGTSWAALVDCVFIAPGAMWRNYFTIPPKQKAWALQIAAVGVGAALLGLARPRGHAWWMHASGAAKLLLGVVALVGLWNVDLYLILNGVTPFAWLVLRTSDRDGAAPTAFARLALAWLAVLDPLQMYPIAGSQVTFGALPAALCGLVCFGDAIAWVVAVLPAAARQPARWATGVGLLAAAVMMSRAQLATFETVYRNEVPLGLPGTERTHVLRWQAAELQSLVASLRERCGLIFAAPGFNSLYFWTGQEPPTLDLVTNDLRILSDVREDAIVAALARSPDSCVVRYRLFFPPEPRFDARIEPLFTPWRQITRYQVLVRRE